MADQNLVPTKACVKCLVQMPATPAFFFRSKSCRLGVAAMCKACRASVRKAAAWASDVMTADRQVAWRKKNLAKARAVSLGAYYKNREANSLRSLVYYHANKSKVRIYQHRKYHTSAAERLRVAVSSGVRKSLRDRKGGRPWESLVGYGLGDLMKHIERQFLPGMSWNKPGSWHLDHIVPLSSFSFSSPDDLEFKAAWALANLRPLWRLENMRKGSKRTHLL